MGGRDGQEQGPLTTTHNNPPRRPDGGRNGRWACDHVGQEWMACWFPRTTIHHHYPTAERTDGWLATTYRNFQPQICDGGATDTRLANSQPQKCEHARTDANVSSQFQDAKTNTKTYACSTFSLDSGTWSVMGQKQKDSASKHQHHTCYSGSDKLVELEDLCQNDFVS
jgi:hypothetical protein